MGARRTFLFVTWEGGGNVPPVLGLAKKMIDRGHCVVILGEPCLRHRVMSIGAKFIAFTAGLTRERAEDVLLQDWRYRTPPAALKHTMDVLMFGQSMTIAQQVSDALVSTGADVLVADWLLPCALIPAEARGVPSVALVHCINMLPGPGKPSAGMLPARGAIGRLRDQAVARLMNYIADGFLSDVNATRAEFGVGPLTHSFELFERATRILVQSSEAFDFPITPSPKNLRYVGPCLDDPADAPNKEISEISGILNDNRSIVVASLSTTFQNQAGKLQMIITALGKVRDATDQPVRAIVTAGPVMRDVEFQKPENVTVVHSAPHSLLFPYAAAFITHCGHGSVMRALSHGVPLIALPMGRDQEDTAARIVARGVGVRPKARVASVVSAVNDVVNNTRYTQAARDISVLLKAEAAANLDVAELEALTVPAKRRLDD